MTHKNLSYALLCSALVVLAACQSKKKDEGAAASTGKGSAEVLLTIDGKPAITAAEFEQFYEQLLEQQPQLRQFQAFMPDLKENVYESMVSFKLIEKWGQESGLENKAEYKKDLEQRIANEKRKMAMEAFQKEHPVTASDSEVKKFYDEHKDTMYLMSPEGIAASGVSFDSEAAAKAFLAKAQAHGADLAKLAGDAKLQVRNFGRVNAKSPQVEQKLRDKILGMKQFPSTQLFTVDKTFWVVQAKSKDTAKHFPFEQAKEDAHNRLMAERMGQVFTKEVGKLKSKYAVVENKDYFAKQKTMDKKQEIEEDIPEVGANTPAPAASVAPAAKVV